MNTDEDIEQLLQWRLRLAEKEAPPAPRASRLLEFCQPWWEVSPARSRRIFDRIAGLQFSFGHAMVAGGGSRSGHPVPVLLMRGDDEIEAAARVLYFNLRDGQLRLRFQLDAVPAPLEPALQVTFVAVDSTPLFAAEAVLTGENEYRLETAPPAPLSATWANLKVTDPMPFRFVLGPAEREA